MQVNAEDDIPKWGAYRLCGFQQCRRRPSDKATCTSGAHRKERHRTTVRLTLRLSQFVCCSRASVNGAMAASKIINGTARRLRRFYSAAKERAIWGGIPGAVITKPTPKIRPSKTAKRADQNAIKSVSLIAVVNKLSPVQPLINHIWKCLRTMSAWLLPS